MHNPFERSFVKRECEFYNLQKYSKDGIKIEMREILGRCDDIFNVNFIIEPLNCPVFTIDGQLWMSLTPMEIQSQYIPIQISEGNVGIAGLGMGYSLLRIMEKGEVTNITVFEKDQRVLDFFKTNFNKREGYQKVKFICDDVRSMKNRSFDFFYNDIYKSILEDRSFTDMSLLTKNNNINNYWFWGEEKIYKVAYEMRLVSERLIPDYVLDQILLWLETEKSKLRDNFIDIKFVKRAIETLYEN